MPDATTRGSDQPEPVRSANFSAVPASVGSSQLKIIRPFPTVSFGDVLLALPAGEGNGSTVSVHVGLPPVASAG
jgi:hypothetical protein